MQPVDHEEKEACNCGNCGCLEQYASATGIVRVAELWLLQMGRLFFANLQPFSKDVLDAFKGRQSSLRCYGTGVGECGVHLPCLRV